jgi:hypothetical protein
MIQNIIISRKKSVFLGRSEKRTCVVHYDAISDQF